MPIYEYRCEQGHLFEVMQKITDDPLTACPQDGSAVQRVFHPVAVHFKGSGFYNTDYGTAKRKREQAAQDSGGDKADVKKDGKQDTKKEGGKPSSPATSGGTAD